MSTALLEQPMPQQATAAHALRAALTARLNELNPAAATAGLTAFIFYTTAGVPLLLSVAGRLQLDAAQTSSWFFVVFLSTAISSLGLSLLYRQPLPVNWSLPGLLFLGGLAGQFTYAELVGANIMAGAVILLAGVFGVGGRLSAIVPLPIALAMFAGSVLGNLSDLVVATVSDGIVAGLTIAGYLLGRRVAATRVPPLGVAALSGALAIVLTGRITPVEVVWSAPVVLMPEAHFTWAAFSTISLPLVVLSLVLGNVQGVGFLKAQGYRVPVNVLTLVTGLQSLLNALCGGHQAIVGRNGVAILAAPTAGPLIGRYWGSVIASGLLVPVAFAAGPLSAFLLVVPPAYVAALAGLAILPAFQDALGQALSGRLRLGAVSTFIIAATPFTLGGITSGCWALVVGIVVSLIAEHTDLFPASAPADGATARHTGTPAAVVSPTQTAEISPASAR